MKRAYFLFLLPTILSLPSDLFFQENRTVINLLIQTDFSYLRDTLYTLKLYFIEVNLATQNGYLHSRTEDVKEFGLSTGNIRLEDGVETNMGLYVIQIK